MTSEYIPKRAMSIHAHPDDQEFTVAGTLAKWAKAGCEIVSVIVTSGESGSNDPQHDPDYKTTLARIREGEQRAANDVIGVKETVYLRFPDGELEPTIQLRKELTRVIRQHKPEVVFTGNPEAWFYGNEYLNHPDHRAAARAACEAVFPSAGTRLIFTDLLLAGYEPHNVKWLYIHGVEKPDTWVDISGTIDIKVNALRKHASQLEDWDPDKMIHQWAAEEGREKGIPLAEAYKVMILQSEEEKKD
jgi:LmbE family N-acetylglucosaminyl deacetylase